MMTTSKALVLGIFAVLSTGFISTGCGATVRTSGGRLSVELEDNRIVIHDHIRFGHDSAEILAESFELLDSVAALIQEHTEIYRVQVQGHTSTDGDEAHNQELSEQRAAAVATYLREHGVSAEITSQGYGETYPQCHEETEDCHEQNRRVEFYVDHR